MATSVSDRFGRVSMYGRHAEIAILVGQSHLWRVWEISRELVHGIRIGRSVALYSWDLGVESDISYLVSPQLEAKWIRKCIVKATSVCIAYFPFCGAFVRVTVKSLPGRPFCTRHAVRPLEFGGLGFETL